MAQLSLSFCVVFDAVLNVIFDFVLDVILDISIVLNMNALGNNKFSSDDPFVSFLGKPLLCVYPNKVTGLYRLSTINSCPNLCWIREKRTATG